MTINDSEAKLIRQDDNLMTRLHYITDGQSSEANNNQSQITQTGRLEKTNNKRQIKHERRSPH